MADDLSKDEARLRLLGERVRMGWAKLHPPTEQQRAAVREVVRQQNERVQQATKYLSADNQETSQETTRKQGKSKSKSKSTENSKSGGVQDGGGSSNSKKTDQSKDQGYSY